MRRAARSIQSYGREERGGGGGGGGGVPPEAKGAVQSHIQPACAGCMGVEAGGAVLLCCCRGLSSQAYCFLTCCLASCRG